MYASTAVPSSLGHAQSASVQHDVRFYLGATWVPRRLRRTPFRRFQRAFAWPGCSSTVLRPYSYSCHMYDSIQREVSHNKPPANVLVDYGCRWDMWMEKRQSHTREFRNHNFNLSHNFIHVATPTSTMQHHISQHPNSRTCMCISGTRNTSRRSQATSIVM